ncbi:MAG: M28 family peptidase [Acidobacteriaceae bacterium]|nr:M28 family peptidase [Acidobacteriaceae bacterium]
MAARATHVIAGIVSSLFLLIDSHGSSAQTLRVDPELTKTIREVRAEVSGTEAMDFLIGVYRTDRWANFAKFQESAQYLGNTIREIGLSNVESLSAPADGVTQYGFWTMPLAWDVKQAKLVIVEPAASEAMRVLADYQQEPASLIMWSGPTPSGGITADVVELKPSTLQQLSRTDVKGKFVLTEPSLNLAQRGALKSDLYKRGAAGMLSYATENPNLINSHYWMNAWGDYGWGYTKTSSPLVGFSITPRQGGYISNLLAQGTKVRVKALAVTRYYSGQYPYITAVIPGSDPGEEVLELGHAFELGAQDNSTGVAAMLEAGATLRRLIEAGKLPRPSRSIRILVMSEDYGSSAYIATHMDRMKQTIGAICIDTPAGPYAETGGYTFALNPDVSRSYQDALVMHVAESYYAGLGQRFPRWSPYRPRSDSYLSDPMIGVSTVSATGSTGAQNLHHNGADTVEHVDPRSLRDLSSIIAVFLYSLASAGDKDISWLAEITADRGDENSIRAAAPFLSRIPVTENGDSLALQLGAGLAQVKYNADRDQEALLSVLRLGSLRSRARLRANLNELIGQVRQFADGQCQRLQEAAHRRARELGVAPQIKPTESIEALSAEAGHLIVKRKRFGPVTLDDLPLEAREGYPGFGDSPAPLTLLYWCDGKRSVNDVARLIQLEQGPMKFDFLGYFKFLAKHGYVELVPAGE